MITYGQKLYLANGGVEVSGCPTPEDATYEVVSVAISSGDHPPKWWQYWIPKWPKHCIEEYQKQITV